MNGLQFKFYDESRFESMEEAYIANEVYEVSYGINYIKIIDPDGNEEKVEVYGDTRDGVSALQKSALYGYLDENMAIREMTQLP